MINQRVGVLVEAGHTGHAVFPTPLTHAHHHVCEAARTEAPAQVADIRNAEDKSLVERIWRAGGTSHFRR